VLETLSPKDPPCLVHLTVKQNAEEKAEYYGLLSNGNILALKVESDDGYQIYRCDLEDHKDQCYRKANESSTCSEMYFDASSFFLQSVLTLFAPSALKYNSSAYPVNAQCLDGSDGCKKYCDITNDEQCVLVNSDGYFVQDLDGNNWTFSDFSLDVFETDTCESPSTHIPAPVDVCSAHHSSSTTPTPTPTPSTATSSTTPGNPSINSASTVKSFFAVVALVSIFTLL